MLKYSCASFRLSTVFDAHCGSTYREKLAETPDDASPLSFGNSRYKVTFDSKAEDPSTYPVFGHRYSFYLQDAVEDVPEYVVQWEPFRAYVLRTVCLLRS